jgi:hypothetical protein
MLRSGLIAALALMFVPASAAAAAPASVTLTGCVPNERRASFEARMEQIPGAERMKLRFSLEGRRPGRAWKRVPAPELAGWRTANPETTRFISERNVTKLAGPSYYRALVRFRWLDDDGHVVVRAKLRSRACWQPDHRSNLKLRELSFEAAGSYVALVANTGRSPTGAFELAITGLATFVVADGLQPGEERQVEAVGPACEPGVLITATVDPLDLIDERNERDNSVSRYCPSGRAS